MVGSGAPVGPSSRRRKRRWLLAIGLTVLLLMSTAYAVLRVKFEGEDLGDNIASLLNKRMRGRISIGSIEWPAAELKKVVTGGWVPLTLRDVRVWDDCALSAVLAGNDADQVRAGDPNEDCTPDDRPDPSPTSMRKPRKRLLETSLITAEIDLHALMFGNHDFVFRNVWIHGGEAVIEETREPYPLHAYDRVIVSIVTAFYPRMKAGFRAGIYAGSSPPVFDLRDIHIDNLNLTVHMKPYSLGDPERIGYAFTGRLLGVNVDSDRSKLANDSYLYMNPTDPLVAKFYVRLAVTAREAKVRILDEGPRTSFQMPSRVVGSPTVVPPDRSAQYEIGLTDIQLRRLAQMPTEWARRNYVANTLELDLSAKTLPCPGAGVDTDPRLGAELHISGELNQYWDRPYDGSWNLRLDAKNLGPTVRSCIKSTAGGDDLHGTITLTGPFVAAPKIGLDLKNLDLDIPLSDDQEPLRLTLAEVHGGIDLVNEQGFIDKTKALIRGGKEPGEVELSATFGLKPMNANAQVEITKAIDVGRFLPERVATSVGKFLKGRLRARGDVEVGFALEDFDLALGPTATSTAIHVHKGRLFTSNAWNRIEIEKVAVEAGLTRAVFDGAIDLLNERYEKLRIEGDYPDLDVWLRRFGLPALVKSAGGGSVIIIDGPLKNPTVNITTELAGVPCIDKIRLLDTKYQDGILQIGRMTSQGLGGDLSGSGRVRVGKGAAPFIERLSIKGRRLEASKLCKLGVRTKGILDTVEADLTDVAVDPKRPALDWLDHATVFAKAAKLSVDGDPYSDVSLCINRKDDIACRPRAVYASADDLAKCASAKKTGGTCIVATARRDRGGVIDATIAKLPPSRGARSPSLGGAVSVDLPLAALEQAIGTKIVGGDSRTTLHLSGTPTAPQATGHLTLLRTWVANKFIGDSQLRVEPVTLPNGQPGVVIEGRALADRLHVRGTLGTTAPYPVELTVQGHRIEVDTAIDLTKLLGMPEPIQAWASGTITLKTELAPARPVEPEAWVELNELVAIVNHRAADGRLTPLRMSVIDQQPGIRPAMSLRVTPASIELACRDASAPGGRAPCTTKLATPAGVVEVRGHAAETSVAIEALGTLDLALLAPLFDTRFDDVTGTVKLAASVSGTFGKPNYEASIDLDPTGTWKTSPQQANPVRIRPVGGDTVIEAPTGLIKVANGSLGFTDVLLQVRDEHLDEKGELHVKGNILLDGLTPANWSVLISGKLAGKMLLAAVPGLVSQAGGLATIDGDLILSGKGKAPLISGTLSFDPGGGRPFSVIPRGVRRELSFTRGSIDIETVESGAHRTYELAINDLVGSIDGEGTLSNINGAIDIRNGVLTRLRATLDADNLPFRIPGTLDLIVSARNIALDKPSESARLAVRGKLSIIDGAYVRSIELTDQIRTIGAVSTPGRPFWEEYPTIGDADLRLELDVRRFSVKINIATIDFVGPLIQITNTPRDPRLSGSIRVQRGEFRIPGTRARFTRSSGSIDFAENTRAGDPQLLLQSEADYRDLSGQEHLITVSIFGSLANPQWDLKTSTGYNKSQTLSLLLLGRNQESLRRSLGDQSVGVVDPTRDPTTNPSQGVADQIVKDLAGDWVSGLLGDSLKNLTQLDVFRVEIGFGSIGLRLEKRMFENIRAIGDIEQTIRGTTVNVNGVLQTPWRVRLFNDISFQGGYLKKDFYDPAEQDIEDANAKVVFRLFIP